MSTLESRISARHRAEPITVVGAGPAGLGCAIALARAGRPVIVREWHSNVGSRFHGDFQGLENWSDERDLLDELAVAGIEATFEHHPVSNGIIYDSRGSHYRVQSQNPLFYLVRRGAEEGCLDHALLRQAVAAGVDVRFGERADVAQGATVLAIGPRLADAIAVGYVFETDMPDGSWLILDNRLAPLGYAYLLIHGGRCTAARSILDGTDYTSLWRRELRPLLRAGTVNRFLFNLVGEPGWRAAAKSLSQGDTRSVLRRFYRPSVLSRILFPVARLRYRAPLRDRSCDHVDCHCVWCECQAELKATALA